MTIVSINALGNVMKYIKKTEERVIFIEAQKKYEMVKKNTAKFLGGIKFLVENVMQLIQAGISIDELSSLLKMIVGEGNIEEKLVKRNPTIELCCNNICGLLKGDLNIFRSLGFLERDDGDESVISTMKDITLSHIQQLQEGIEKNKAGTFNYWCIFNWRKVTTPEQRIKELRRMKGKFEEVKPVFGLRI